MPTKEVPVDEILPAELLYQRSIPEMVLKVKINNSPKKRTILNNKNTVILLLTTIFFKEYVGILLINKTEITRKKTGTNTL